MWVVAPRVVQAQGAGSALDFDGIGDYVAVPSDPSLGLTGDYSIELFLKPDGTFDPSASDYQGLLDKGDYQMYLDPGDGKLKFVQPGAGSFSARFAPNFDGPVYAMAMYDNELYVGGDFTTVNGLVCNHIARWNGTQWQSVGTGTDGPVYSLTVLSGYYLYAGGSFSSASGIPASNIAKWDGATWSNPFGQGTNGPVYALLTSSGMPLGAVYAGGSFTTAGGEVVNHIAYFNGSSWYHLGTGIGVGGQDAVVYALEFADWGSGLRLYVGGHFETAGGAASNHLAVWNPGVGSWETFGTAVNDTVYAIAKVGLRLYAGGRFTTAPGGTSATNLVMYDGVTWQAFPVQISDTGRSVRTLWGTGNALYVGGDFTSIGGYPMNGLAAWNYTRWSALGGGVSGNSATVFALKTYGSGDPLYVGGQFDTAGGQPTRNFAKLAGINWSSLGSGVNNGPVEALAVYDDDGEEPHPPALYAGGYFTAASGVSASMIARWDGTSWSPLGSGMNGSVKALAVFDDDGAGPRPSALYAGGWFTTAGGASANYIARWDGSIWESLGSGMSDYVYALTVYDDDDAGPHPPALYAGGYFTIAGGVSVSRIAKWDGTNWSTLGSGTNAAVLAFAVFDDDGPGPHLPALYAGGEFTTAGGVTVNHIAKWDGTTWSALGTGMSGSGARVEALSVFDDDGVGPHLSALYAGGYFPAAGGVAVNNIAKWDGATWSSVGGGTSGVVYSLAVYDEDGPGLHPGGLVVGGGFTAAGGVSANRIAKWDGTTWSALGSGFNSYVYALAGFDDDGEGSQWPTLYAGGDFSSSGSIPLNFIAKAGSDWSYWKGMDDTVHAFAGWGTPYSNLYAAGQFDSAGGVSGTRSIALWTGTAWSMLANGTNGVVFALAPFGSPTNELYAAGSFTLAGAISANNIARWGGSWWNPGGTNGVVWALGVRSATPGELYIGGQFTTAGGQSASNIAMYTTSASWSALGTGITGGTNPGVFAIAVYNDEVYVGGQFTTAGGQPANNLAKWNGSTWSTVGEGTDGPVYALAVAFGALWVGGAFTTAGGVPANGVAYTWDAATWFAAGDGVSGGSAPTVKALAVYNNELYAGGTFTQAGGLSANNLAKWSGAEWTAVGSGTNDTVEVLYVYNNELWIGGAFTSAGGIDSSRVAVWTQPMRTIASARAVWAMDQYHVAVTHDGDNLSLYVNGVLETTAASTSGGGEATARPLGLGAIRPRIDGGSGQFFNGQIDEVRIWNVYRTQTEIRDNLNRKLVGTEPGLVAYYRFDEGSGSLAGDSTTNANDGTLVGPPTWETSTAPLGDASIWAPGGNPGPLSSPYGDSFEVTDLTGSPPFVAVIRVDGAPNSTAVEAGLFQVFDSHYYEVWIPGGGSAFYTAIYHYAGHPDITNENGLALASRPDADAVIWEDTWATLDTGADTLTIAGQSGTQYVLAELGIELNMEVSPPGAGTTIPPPSTWTTYPLFGTANITAIPNPGYVFDHWETDAGAAPVVDPDCPTDATVVMDVSKMVVALFVPGSVIASDWIGGTACAGFGPEGCWKTAANWCPRIVPDNVTGRSFDVTIADDTAVLDLSPTIDSLVLNAATVQVDDAAGAPVRTLAVLNPITNNGTFRATDGRLVLDAPAIDQTGGGDLQADSNGVIQINGALVTGGEAHTFDCTSTIELIGGAEFNNVTITSDCARAEAEAVVVPDAQSGVLGGAILNEGGVRVGAVLDITTLAPAAGGVTLSGTGAVVLADQDLAWFGAFGRTITNASGHRIEGEGLLWGHVVNQGTIRANAAGRSLVVSSPGNKTNTGAMEATSGGTLWLADDITGSGTFLADGGTIRVESAAKALMTVGGTSLTITNLGAVLMVGDAQMTLTGAVTIDRGGTYHGATGATASLTAGSVAIANSGAEGGEVSLSDGMGLVVTGDITLLETGCKDLGRGCTPPILSVQTHAGLDIAGSFTIQGEGEMHVQSLSVSLGGDFDNQSHDPSGFDWSNGALQLSGGLKKSGVQVIEVAGTDRGVHPVGWQNNVVIGRLEVAAGANARFVDARDNNPAAQGDCSEAFYVDDLVLRSGSTIELQRCRVYCHTLTDEGAVITPTGCGELVVVPIPDFDDDGDVDLNDYGPWVACLTGPGGVASPGCESADLDNDGDVDLGDFALFQEALTGSGQKGEK